MYVYHTHDSIVKCSQVPDRSPQGEIIDFFYHTSLSWVELFFYYLKLRTNNFIFCMLMYLD